MRDKELMMAKEEFYRQVRLAYGFIVEENRIGAPEQCYDDAEAICRKLCDGKPVDDSLKNELELVLSELEPTIISNGGKRR